MSQSVFIALLREHLAMSQAKNRSYSIRAFAKRLGLGVGTVSQVLSGKRKLAEKSVRKVLDRLGVGPADRARIFKAPKEKSSYEQSQLQADQYFILSEWYYLAILNLIRTRDFQATPEHISGRLGIPPVTARRAIERLLRVNLVRMENKKLLRTHVALKTTDGIPDIAIRKSHYETLDRARLALDEDPIDTFDLSALTFAFAPEDLNEAKKMIREFQDEFAEQFSTSKRASEVYRLATQFFSLTRPRRKK